MYHEQAVHRIYAIELQLNKANSSDTEVPFLVLNLSVSKGIVSTNIDCLNFDVVNFPFLNDDVPRRSSYRVYVPQLIRFASASHVSFFNNLKNS